ncbi:glycosyl hydrolase [Mucilaginibacter achroorhodeus]|uniref:Glycosyl hydrolase n=1 Tax=Mucilaginibacter achroorhodeus TaxID=2599294 RepID=A0A563U211_9SPHI|nr:glycoside hydrolase family 38 C-terminal domain-containing protein [Mucilaginibacter achroorhodeus]TWR24619.1 glycosyl hydrolase [Mucilaginibacter achroorhodeus]
MHLLKNRKLKALLTAITLCAGINACAQKAWYIDGYHGGVWGHYPDWNTRFMADMLNKHAFWKINLEIEPETWDRASKIDPQAFADLQSLMKDQSAGSARIEYVNPAYGQPYMYNIDGESIIRQLGYGMQKLRTYFPGISFETYSSEEPCFTNALPGILRSYGFRYASLKNPNTCFGGYTRAFGGELVNWIGPDGSTIITSPRYAIEKLEPNSTWQTIAWNNSPKYIDAARKYGITSPIGMTLQDAGWKGGPFLGKADSAGQRNIYTTWRNYFENVTRNDKHTDWKVSQEDILVSLVWGSQVTQQIAQRVRAAENNILTAEKILVINKLSNGTAWPTALVDSAWRTLLLSQHHDCWIVPYNGDKGDTWADKVIKWTGNTNYLANNMVNGTAASKSDVFTIYNTQGKARAQLVAVAIPLQLRDKNIAVKGASGKLVKSQVVKDSVFINASVPAFGFQSYHLRESTIKSEGSIASKLADGKVRLETDLYKLVIDPEKGGSIVSLILKKYNKEMIDKNDRNGFNTLRGNFYNNGGLKKSIDNKADVQIIENGALRSVVQVKGSIAGTAFTQIIRLSQSSPVIDMQVNINWTRNVAVGEDVDRKNYKWTDYKKPFYNDSNKLVTVFPLNLAGQKVYKNAPFEVTESKLNNTFFNSWDGIKNNVILNWVDVTDARGDYGMALLTDHTTSYTHGENFPLGLVTQYSGMGLWGRDYFTDGPTTLHYAIIPHKGDWEKAGIWSTSAGWNEPLKAVAGSKLAGKQSLVDAGNSGLVLTSATAGSSYVDIRFLNAEGTTGAKNVTVNFKFKAAALVELDGRTVKDLQQIVTTAGARQLHFEVPHMGFRTVRFQL